MKRYLLSIILCLWASCAWAFPPGFIGAVASGEGSYCTGKTSLVCRDFDEAGTPSGMSTVAGDATVNYDSISPLLDGSQSLRITAGSVVANIDTGIFAAQTALYAGGRFQFSNLAQNNTLFEFRNAAQGRGSVKVLATGALEVTAPGGTTYLTGTGIVSVGTPIYILCGVTTGTGAASTSCQTSTDGINFGTVYSKADGTFTGDWDRVWLDIPAGTNSYSVDRWRVENASFTF